MRRRDRERTLLDLPHAGLAEELHEVSLPGTRPSGPVIDVGVQRVDRLPEVTQRSGASAVVPDAGGDDTTGVGHPRHLPEALDRVGLV